MALDRRWMNTRNTTIGLGRENPLPLPDGWKSAQYPNRYQLVALELGDEWAVFEMHEIHPDRLVEDNLFCIDHSRYPHEAGTWVELHIYIDRRVWDTRDRVVREMQALVYGWLNESVADDLENPAVGSEGA